MRRRAASGKRAGSRPSRTFDKIVEHVEASELIGDDRFNRIASERAEECIEGMLDDRKGVAGAQAYRIA